MRVGIVAQQSNARAAALAGDLLEEVRAAGGTVVVDEVTASALDLDDAGAPTSTFDGCDLVVSIGGDGTFLYAARHADTTPVLGVNLGEVGFLNAVAPGDAVDAVLDVVEEYETEGAVSARAVHRLEATAEAAPETTTDAPADAASDWEVGPALNEVTVQSAERGRGGGLSVEVRVDGSLYTATRADGVIVATPTGSTAYNLSEGGPLLHPAADGFVLTGMCPKQPMPPVVVSHDSEIAVRAADAAEIVLAADGRIVRRLDSPQWIRVRRTPRPARVAGPSGEFFQALSKLE